MDMGNCFFLEDVFSVLTMAIFAQEPRNRFSGPEIIALTNFRNNISHYTASFF